MINFKQSEIASFCIQQFIPYLCSYNKCVQSINLKWYKANMEKLSINTERLTIRNLEIKDLSDFYVYRSNPEVTKYQGFDIMDKQQASDFIERQADKLYGKPGEWVQYGIEENKTKTLIGDCAIKLEDDPRIAQIGITINPGYQKKGYAKEVMIGLMTWLFEVKNIHRLTEIVDEENTSSINLLKSLHFRKEGHFIKNVYFNNKWGSEFQYAMLNSEWRIKKYTIAFS